MPTSILFMFSISVSKGTFWPCQLNHRCSIPSPHQVSNRDTEGRREWGRREGWSEGERRGSWRLFARPVRPESGYGLDMQERVNYFPPGCTCTCTHTHTHTHTHTDKRRVETLLLNITAAVEWSKTKEGNVQ